MTKSNSSTIRAAKTSAWKSMFPAYRWTIVALIIFMLSYCVEWTLCYINIEDRQFNMIFFLKMGLDALMLFLPFLILSRRWQPLIMITVWFMPIFLYVNLLYYRFFGDFIPFYIYKFTGNINPVTINSAKILLQKSDLLFAAIPLAVTVAYFAWLRKKIAQEPKLGARMRWRWFFVFIAVIIVGQSMTFVTHTRYGRSIIPGYSYRDTFEFRYLKYPPDSQGGQLLDKGVPAYILVSLIQQIILDKGAIDLTDEQRARIESFIAENPYDRSEAITANRGKNLILIIVESLNSWAVGYEIDGYDITPTLSRLIAEEGTISNLNVVTQVSVGVSSDGQLLYNTGLLPLRNDAVSMRFVNNTFPSIAKELEGYSSAEINPVSSALWNHHVTHQLVGYSKFYGIKEVSQAYPDIASIGKDAAMFDFAVNVIDSLKQPFIIELATVSTHPPFEESILVNDERLQRSSNLDETKKKYLSAVRYFDDCLDRFIERLKADGIYDNSVIVIAADHDVSLEARHSGPSNGNIPFIAVNAGVTKKLDRVAGQIDIYPTLLDIMGVSSPRWKGLGVSMLTELLNSAADKSGAIHGSATEEIAQRQLDAWNISDLIIRGDYFANP